MSLFNLTKSILAYTWPGLKLNEFLVHWMLSVRVTNCARCIEFASKTQTDVCMYLSKCYTGYI